MHNSAREVLDEVHAKLNEFKVELDARMNAVATNRAAAAANGTGQARPSQNSESAPTSARVPTNGLVNHQVQYCGPYKLEKTLGKGQTGLVKSGTHCITGRKVAVKIVNKEKLNESVLQKVEREIAIMKLIEHPHVLNLYDVYENKKYLYLLLEHVSGGELFDYLVRKGRLMAKEARKFFRQIISALDFCHAQNICHRDLKPENLLLDERNNIKIADFGMASLQLEGSMLETSCGSPHYACPEVIRGEKYDGRKADVWSCGVILFALLVGALPFDDDNLRNLLEKVKKGVFHIPHFVPTDCQNLLRSMIEVDPVKRISLQDVFKHPWVTGGNTKGEPDLELPISQVVQTHVIPSEENIDPDVFRHMNNLGCFKDKERLVSELLSPKHNTEKIVYFLLLDRKRRRPAQEDETEVVLRGSNHISDPPRKRTDTSRPKYPPAGSISEGSPINPRKTYGRHGRNRHNSLTGSPNDSPRSTIRSFYGGNNRGDSATALLATARQANTSSISATTTPSASTNSAVSMISDSGPAVNHQNSTSSNGNSNGRGPQSFHYYTQPVDPAMLTAATNRQARKKETEPYTTTSNTSSRTNIARNNPEPPQSYSNMGSAASSSNSIASGGSNSNISSIPWRSKINSIKNSFLGTPRFHRRKLSSGSGTGGESDSEDSSMLDTSDLVKKSWFGSLTSGIGSEREDVQCIPVEGKSLNAIKAELIRAFLTIHELNHQVVGERSFKVEYRRGHGVGGSNVFSRGIKLHVDIIPTDQSESPDSPFFFVQFTLNTGPIRRFRRLVDHLAIVLHSSQQQRREQPNNGAKNMVKPRQQSESQNTTVQQKTPTIDPTKSQIQNSNVTNNDSQRRNTSGAILENLSANQISDERISIQQLQKKRSVGSSTMKNKTGADGVIIYANHRNGSQPNQDQLFSTSNPNNRREVRTQNTSLTML